MNGSWCLSADVSLVESQLEQNSMRNIIKLISIPNSKNIIKDRNCSKFTAFISVFEECTHFNLVKDQIFVFLSRVPLSAIRRSLRNEKKIFDLFFKAN